MTRVLLGVCGGVSFYKSFEILRALQKRGFEVSVALSKGASEFVTPLAYEGLGARVLTQQNASWSGGLNHIEFSKADLLLLAPATANTLAKVACGVADDVFLQTLLAYGGGGGMRVVAPAMNWRMWQNAATQRNVEFLKQSGWEFVNPVCKTLACGETGEGGLAEVEVIVASAVRALRQKRLWRGRKVVVTGGATCEKIDDVRGVTNFSSGKFAKAIADAFFYAGAEVTLLHSAVQKAGQKWSFEGEVLPYECVKFQSSASLLDLLNKQDLTPRDLLVMNAAVSDFLPALTQNGKVKKQNFALNLELKENVDLLKSLASKCKKVGFKLEMCQEEVAVANARQSLEKRGLDAVCLNILQADESGSIFFGSDKTQIRFLQKSGCLLSSFADKSEVAGELVGFCEGLFEV